MSEVRLSLRLGLDLGKGSGFELEVGFGLWAGLALPSNLVKCTQKYRIGLVSNNPHLGSLWKWLASWFRYGPHLGFLSVTLV